MRKERGQAISLFSEMEKVASSQLCDDEDLLFSQSDISLTSDQDDVGIGELTVTSQRILWRRTDDESCLSIEVTRVLLHAISRDLSTFPKPCIYAQLQIDEENTADLYLSPADPDTLSAIFDAFSKAAALNPDDEEDEEDESGGCGLITREDMLGRFDDMLSLQEKQNHGDEGRRRISPSLPEGCDGGQFDDAPEDDDSFDETL